MRFEYLKAMNLEEAGTLLIRYDEKAKVIAGGTDLLVRMRRRSVEPEYVIDISRISGLDYIHYDDKKGLQIGATTTIQSLLESAEVHRRYNVISEAARQLASEGIRNTATIGGNLCNASPSADMAPSLISLSAVAKIAGPREKRDLLLGDFFTGAGKTALRKGELLAGIVVPPTSPRTGATYLKHGIRGSIDLAIVGVAAAITLEKNGQFVQSAIIALGAVAPTPIRARKAEAALTGKQVTDLHIQDAAHWAAAECRPIDDVRASADYRKEMVSVLTGHAISEALARAKSA